MRDKFETARSRDLLARSDDGYLDAATDREWTIWQLAWSAALSRESHRTGEGSPFSTLTAEEVEFVKRLYVDSHE